MLPEAARISLARTALAEIPKLLTLLDRMPVSPTFGCFDRAYWHYRLIDFPSGMSQEFVLPLALAWSLDLPDNPYRAAPALRSWIEAGIRFAAGSAHPDGSCDDYYPFERATGAAAFSLFAILEAADLIDLRDDDFDAFLKRRAGWLAAHEESGRLANHEALVVCCLQRMSERFGGDAFEAPMRRRLGRLLGWQSSEGWFSEYGGADLGYLSLTIGLLADLDRRRPDLGLREALASAIRFAAEFVHPDGTTGGEYSSRGTLNFFPHGFEIAGAWMPDALALNDRALRPLVENRLPCYSDDRIIGHHLWSWLMTWREFRHDRPAARAPVDGRRWFPEAGLIVDRSDGLSLFAAPGRGGVFKLFGGEALVVSDTGPTFRVGPKGRVAVTHLAPSSTSTQDQREIVVEGRMTWAKNAKLTPAKNIVLRLVMVSLGRFFPDLVRRVLQRLLVTGRRDAPFRYRRVLTRSAEGWTVKDEIQPDRGWSAVTAAGISGFQLSMTTITARVFQADQFQPWLDLTPQIRKLAGLTSLVVERHYGRKS